MTDVANSAYAVTVNDTSITAANLITLNTLTDTAITVNSSTVTGTRANVNTVLGYATTVATGLDDIDATVSDASTVDEINATAALTTGSITATISNVDVATLSGLHETGNVYTISITDGTVSAAAVNAINAKTDGVITLTSTNVTGALTCLLYTSDAADE